MRPSMRSCRFALVLGLALHGVTAGSAACSTGPATSDAGVDGGPVDWVIDVDPAAAPSPSGALDPALLGHYDLSGALFSYDQVPGLVDAMKTAGFLGKRLARGRRALGDRDAALSDAHGWDAVPHLLGAARAGARAVRR